MAHTINQLIEHGSLITNMIKRYGSIKNLSQALLDAFRFIEIEKKDINNLFHNCLSDQIVPEYFIVCAYVPAFFSITTRRIPICNTYHLFRA